MRTRSDSRAAALRAAVLLVLLATLRAPGTTYTWTGGGAPDPSWGTADNWDAGSPASANDTDLVFGTATGAATVNNVASPFLLRNVAFGPGAGAFSLSGLPVELYGNVANDSASGQAIALDVALAGDSAWGSGGGDLSLSGDLSGGTRTLTKTGAGTLFLSGNVADLGGLRLAGGLVALGAGTVVTNAGTTFGTPATGSLALSSGAFLAQRTTGVVTTVVDAASVALEDADTAWDLGQSRVYAQRGASLTVADGACLTNIHTWSMTPPAQGTFAGSRIVVTNGARVAVGPGNTVVGDGLRASYITARSNEAWIGGFGAASQPSVWDAGGGAVIVGGVRDSTSKAEGNLLTVEAGGIVTNAGLVALAHTQGGNFNTLVVTNGGRVFGTSGGVGGGSVSNGGGNSNAVVVAGNGSLWNVGGGLAIGTTGGGTPAIGNSLRIAGAGAVVTNVTSLGVGNKLANSSSGVRQNTLAVADGGLLASSGEANIGGGYGGTASDNALLVSGIDSRWQAGGDLTVNYGRQGPALRNALVVEQGGSVTGIVRIWVGRTNAQHAHEGLLVVTNGGTLSSSGTVIIGYAHDQGSGLPSHSNRVHVVGGPAASLWALGGADLYIGYCQQGADVACNAFGNAVRVGRGGAISGVDDIFVGHINNSPSYSERIAGNRLELAGGACTAAKLTVRANNAVAPVLDAEGLTSMTVTGTATFNAGSWIAPTATEDAPAGTYTVLTAASVVDNGLALSPETDTSLWSLEVTATQVKVTRSFPATVLIVR